MPFELLKGTTLGWIPEEHGFSQREVKDTIRRMEQLIADLDALWRRKEKEREFHKQNIPDWLEPNDWIGGVDYKKVIDKRLYDVTSHLAIDKAVLEFELPYVEKALEHVPEETPPMRHEDYCRRLQKIEDRRGEYWKINPEFITADDRRAGIGRRTPEKDKYWPTHQVPWKQGSPSPPPYIPPPPKKDPIKRPHPLESRNRAHTGLGHCEPSSTKPQPAETPKRKHEWKSKPSSKVKSTPPVQIFPPITSTGTAETPSSTYCTPVASLASSPADLSFLDARQLFTPPSTTTVTADQDLKELSDLVDEVDALTVQLMKVKSLAHDSVGSPEVAEQQQSICQPTPPGQQPEFNDQSPGIICPERINTEAFSPEELGVDEMHIMMDDAIQRQAAAELIDPCQLQTEAFSPEILDMDTISIMLDDAVQRHTAAEFIDPHQLHSEAFSPEYLDADTIDRMLKEPRGPTALLSPAAQEGLQLMKCEPQTAEGIASRYGYMREERWNERLGRWKKDEERRIEEDRSRAKSMEERQKDAQAVFGVRARPISAPSEPPGRANQLCYEPTTVPWGDSPVDHISPPPLKKPKQKPHMSKKEIKRQQEAYCLYQQRLKKPMKPTGTGKRLVPIKRKSPLGDDPYTTMAPSRLLYPETKGGPTVSQPDLPSTSQTIYNTKRCEYVNLDKWETPHDSYTKQFLLEKHRKKYEKMLKPGPPILPPKPATPPPLPPPEYGPEPEHLSVYIPESVCESPTTLKQRLDEAIQRFEVKIEQVRRKLEPSLSFRIRQESPWVQEEYMDPKPSSMQKQRMKEAKSEKERKAKWENFMFTKFGTATPFPGRDGRIRLPRTASTYRPRLCTPEPLPKKAPINKPYDEPLHGPCLPWVAGSNRPPPRTAAGRIGSPYEPAPKPVVRKPDRPPPTPMPCPPPREPIPRVQPQQVLYGSGRAPPKTAASYKYQTTTPTARPTKTSKPLSRHRLATASACTPEMLYGSARAPPRTAASARPQIPSQRRATATPQGRQDITRCPPSSERTPDPTRSAPLRVPDIPDISPDLLDVIHLGEERIERIRTQMSLAVDSLSAEIKEMLLRGLERFEQTTGILKDCVESIKTP